MTIRSDKLSICSWDKCDEGFGNFEAAKVSRFEFSIKILLWKQDFEIASRSSAWDSSINIFHVSLKSFHANSRVIRVCNRLIKHLAWLSFKVIDIALTATRDRSKTLWCCRFIIINRQQVCVASQSGFSSSRSACFQCFKTFYLFYRSVGRCFQVQTTIDKRRCLHFPDSPHAKGLERREFMFGTTWSKWSGDDKNDSHICLIRALLMSFVSSINYPIITGLIVFPSIETSKFSAPIEFYELIQIPFACNLEKNVHTKQRISDTNGFSVRSRRREWEFIESAIATAVDWHIKDALHACA